MASCINAYREKLDGTTSQTRKWTLLVGQQMNEYKCFPPL